MGDIAQQISKLKQLKKENKSVPASIDLSDGLTFDDLITLHWERIDFLQHCIKTTDDDIKQDLKSFSSGLCDNCKAGKRPCLDYIRTCQIALGKEVLKYKND